MQKVILFFLAATIVAGSMSCKNAGFKKTKAGIWYKVVSGPGAGDYVSNGNVLKFNMTIRYKDSVLRTNVGGMPYYQPIDSTKLPQPYYEMFSKVKAGDSLVWKQLTDSAYRPGSQPMPPFMRKGEYVTCSFKIVQVFKTMQDAQPDAEKEAALVKTQDSIKAIAQLGIDAKIIEDFLAKNNIKAQKGEKGTYVEILNPGTGNLLDSSETVGVNYTGKSLDGEVFDSNTDSTFGHKDTLKIVMGQQGGMIPGFLDGLHLLRNGAKARLYIPSSLAYGANGRSPKIKPNENLTFDLEVVSVATTPKGNPMAMGGMGGPGGMKMTPELMAKIRAMQQAQGARGGQQQQQPQQH
jgi:FKBP-type peptidyl-prolyl cis-trans isomerase FkpA